MTTDITKNFWNKIGVYRNDLSMLKSGVNEPLGVLFAPLFDKKSLSWELTALEKQHYDVSELKKELSKVDDEFDEYIKNNKTTYYNRLYDALIVLINDYDPDGVLSGGYEFESVIEGRTDIEVILEELKDVFDLKGLIQKVTVLDRILQDKIQESIVEKTYAPEDVPYAPANYWWLHLEDAYGKPNEIID